MDGIQQMFAALDGYDEYASQLSIWAVIARTTAAKTARDWREANPIRAATAVANWQARNRDKLRAADAKWRAKLPANLCWCKQPKAEGKSLCETHLERNRAYARRRAA